MDTNGDNVDDVTFKVKVAHDRTYKVLRSTGSDATRGESGDVIVSGTLDQLPDTLHTTGQVRAFAGTVHEAFAGDVHALEE